MKLLAVEKLDNSKYKILFQRDNEEIAFIVKTIPHTINSTKKTYDLIVPEENAQEFSDVWGYSFELRQEVGKKIRELKNQPIPEPQTA